MRFPRGWQTQNLPQAVVGVAPDGTAALELTLAAGDDAERALRAFASQPDVQVGSPNVRRFDGMDGLFAEFAATTPQGQIRGIATFVESGGRVYRLIGYSPASRFPATTATLTSAIGSFSRVTDPSVLSVTANRIDVVHLPQSQTLSEFAQRFPSVVPVDRLAILNHVAGGSARLSAGTLVKRVIS